MINFRQLLSLWFHLKEQLQRQSQEIDTIYTNGKTERKRKVLFKEWELWWCHIVSYKNYLYLFKEWELWWCHIGQNIGHEIYGKWDVFTRPIFILKKTGKYTFIWLPCSSKIQKYLSSSRSDFYFHIQLHHTETIALFDQCRSYDSIRLLGRIWALPEWDYENIKTHFLSYIKNVPDSRKSQASG